jgi:hypothetical protein
MPRQEGMNDIVETYNEINVKTHSALQTVSRHGAEEAPITNIPVEIFIVEVKRLKLNVHFSHLDEYVESRIR